MRIGNAGHRPALQPARQQGATEKRYNRKPMDKPRLRRLERVYVPAPVYFVTACTHARAHWLACSEIRECLVAFCSRGAERGACVGRYVLMPDHFHLVVSFRPGTLSLSGWMKSLKNSLSKTLRTMGKAAPHWQDGFFDHVLRSSESYEQKWLYVKDNPVRAGLVLRSEDWPYQGEIHRLAL